MATGAPMLTLICRNAYAVACAAAKALATCGQRMHSGYTKARATV